MYKCLVALLLMFMVTVVSADPPKVVPVPKPKPDIVNTIDGAVANKMFVLAAEPASRWRLETNSDQVELRIFDNGKTGVFVANLPGLYTITVTGPGGEVSEYRITVSDDGKPIPPTPDNKDVLKDKLLKAFALEPGEAAVKKEFAKDLAELYRQAATLTGKSEIKTSGDLLKKSHDAAVVLIGADKMKEVRRVVAIEIALLLPTDAPLTDNQRTSVAALFKKLAVILDSIGG